MIGFNAGEARGGRTAALTPNEISGRIALLGGSLLTLGAISCAALGFWRVGTDLGWAGDFVVQEGFLSHWQVWMGAAVGVQYTSYWLVRYATILHSRGVEMAVARDDPDSARSDRGVG